MKKLPNIHPGEVLFEEFLKHLGISQNKLARAMGVRLRRINEIVHSKRAVSADTALRLARALGNLRAVLDGITGRPRARHAARDELQKVENIAA